MFDRREQLAIKEDTVQGVINELLDEDTFIENVQQVVEQVQQRHQLNVTGAYISKQFH